MSVLVFDVIYNCAFIQYVIVMNINQVKVYSTKHLRLLVSVLINIDVMDMLVIN